MGNPKRIQDVMSVEVSRITPSTIIDWPAGCYWTGDAPPSTRTTVSISCVGEGYPHPSIPTPPHLNFMSQ